MRTSVLENKSLSTKSATPSSRTLVSANATPTALDFALEPRPDGEFATLIAMTTGADRISESLNRRSSTVCRFPGEASLSNLNFAAFFPWPGSGTHISTRSCLAVNASLRNDCATLILRATDGNPAAFPPSPRYLMTELVLNTWFAT